MKFVMARVAIVTLISMLPAFAQAAPERTDLSVSPMLISNPCSQESILVNQG